MFSLTQMVTESVTKLVQKLRTQKNITIDHSVIKGADHFYQEKTDLLETEVSKYLKASLAARVPAPSAS